MTSTTLKMKLIFHQRMEAEKLMKVKVRGSRTEKLQEAITEKRCFPFIGGKGG
jgi:hypothetical protein